MEGAFYTATEELAKMSLTVDSSDFSEDDVKNNSDKMGKLESTIAHEMMHAVMDATLPKRMHQNGGNEDFPLWFVEGTAQLAGGGFTTGWNEELKKYPTDDAKIASYLKRYTVQNRVYGHGYLAAAYLGYLIGGESVGNISSGINTLFSRLKDHPEESLKQAVNALLAGVAGEGKGYDKVINDINGGTDDGVDFVKKLLGAVGQDGAGSFISAGGPGAKAEQVLGDSTSNAPIFIDLENIGTDDLNEYGPKANAFSIQAGSDNKATNRIQLKIFRMSSSDLGLSAVGNSDKEEGKAVNALSIEGARSAIDTFSDAIKLVSGVRSYYGAMQNRMEHTIKNLDNVVENTAASESKLRDTDMAEEMVAYSKSRILSQAGQAMITQANQSNQGVMAILA